MAERRELPPAHRRPHRLTPETPTPQPTSRTRAGWYVAELLRQYRHQGRWRALVRCTVGPGFTYVHARWCDELRPARPD